MLFKIYSSSAGSGKTYTLTREYLKLALQGDQPHYFKYILAITFTNDAANEMKARIVNALQGFAQPDTLDDKARKGSDQLLFGIAEELGVAPEKLRTRAQKVFVKIIYNYSDFAVSTIDRFVNKITTAFTQELDIPYNYDVDLDTDKLLETAIDRVLAKVGRETKENLSNILVDWAEKKAEEGKNWAQIAPELADFSKDLMNERSYNYLNQLKKLTVDDFQIIKEELFNYKKNLKSQIVTIAEQGLSLMQAQGVGVNDFFQKAKGVGGYFQKLAQGKDLEKPANSYVMQALNNNKWYSGKAQPGIDAIAPSLAQDIAHLRNLKSIYLLVSLITPHIYKMALIHEVESELEELKIENNSIHISDTNKKIAEIISNEPVPFIYERVGEKYNHILIDEFQDTSVLQWQNLLPLVENNLAEHNFNLIVGDAKQAIYRWRGGEMEQLVHLYKNNIGALLQPSLMQENTFNLLRDRYATLHQNHLAAQLKHNYRSTREVIEFNNSFFRDLVDMYRHEFPLLDQIYDEDFEQAIPEQNTKTGGHVEIQFVNKDTYHTDTLEYILVTISTALNQGFAKKDIAVLTRSNGSGQEIAVFLKSKGFPVISQTSLLLASDDKVHFIIAFLKLIKNPHDRLLRSEVLYLFYRVIKRITPDDMINNVIKSLITKPIAEFFEHIQGEGYDISQGMLQQLGVYELVEKLIEVFGLFEHQNRLEYLFRFLDLVIEFNLQKNTTLTDFLEYWEDKKDVVSVNTPKDQDAITITTIHKSKGLEYSVVILPFAEWEYTPKRNSTMWINLPREEFTFKHSSNYLSTSIVQVSSKLAETLVADQYHDEIEKTFIENVNLLYVAFTRAVDRLYIFTRLENFASKKPPKRVSTLMHQYLLNRQFWEEGNATYPIEMGEPKAQGEATEEDEDKYFYIDELISTDIHKRVKNTAKWKRSLVEKGTEQPAEETPEQV
ncbi:UvrD-helicase domain-containing protein [Microscilla marina]|uniref:DNA 3'-5' helicase n=1 Tax=Microscilla marina ATCC 23134 TaxID=313606 RepID=A1ZN69_MICM2|nr:UvrD-helicase domain-containing protein [Microscilla marina]EAY28250.1 UvrD/REP helicase domain protein, putative [Microscilla marina ATCC 23134]